jgi:hypothetical protein
VDRTVNAAPRGERTDQDRADDALADELSALLTAAQTAEIAATAASAINRGTTSEGYAASAQP